MEEFEPKRRNKVIDKEFIAKYSYVLVLAVLLIGGISYGYTFFTQNNKIASGSITTADLTINFTNRGVNATGLTVPTDDQEGLSEFNKSLTITNETNVDGRVKLTLTRTSGLALSDLKYALIVNGAIQEIDDVPNDGEILTSAIMGNETINVEIRLWPKTTYTGNETTFVGEITPEIKYLGEVAVNSINSPAGKYVNFNCSNTCEIWQIVKIENNRLVLTRQADYSGATERVNSNKYNPNLTFNDNSMITSVSTDNKNVYLAKTVKINGGSGTQQDPYILINNDYREPDKKVIAAITYKNGNDIVGTQNIYYNEINYISQVLDDSNFQGWTDGTNDYSLGDIIVYSSSTIELQPKQATSRNDMINFYGNTYFTSEQKASVTEVNFIRMSEENINSHANLVDLTDANGEGMVKGWIEETKLYIASPGITYFPTNCGQLFAYYFPNIEAINFNNINTSEVTSMYAMFDGLTKLNSIDLSKFDTSSVTTMQSMFRNCALLTSINIDNFDFTSVTSAVTMFDGCNNLTSFDLSRVKFGSSTYINGIFYNNFGIKSVNLSGNKIYNDLGKGILRGSKIETIDMRNVDASEASSINGIFKEANYLKTINASGMKFGTNVGGFITNNSNDLNNLETIDFSNADGSLLTSLGGMFSGLVGIKTINLSGANFSNVTIVGGFFAGIGNGAAIDLSNINLSSVTSTAGMFSGGNIDSINLSNANFSGVTSVANMFGSGSSLSSINLSNAKFNSLTNMTAMFQGLSLLTNIDLTGIITGSLTNTSAMFSGCTSLVSVDLSSLNISNVTNMTAMFAMGTPSTSNNVTTWTPSNNALTTIKVGNNWNTSNVTSSDDMFYNCTHLVGGSGTTFDSNIVDKTRAIVDGGVSNPGYLTLKQTD